MVLKARELKYNAMEIVETKKNIIPPLITRDLFKAYWVRVAAGRLTGQKKSNKGNKMKYSDADSDVLILIFNQNWRAGGK